MTWLEIILLAACVISLLLFFGLLILYDVRRWLNNYMAHRRFEQVMREHRNRKGG